MVVGERAEEREKKTFVVCTVTVCTHVRVHTYIYIHVVCINIFSIIYYYLLFITKMYYVLHVPVMYMYIRV